MDLPSFQQTHQLFQTTPSEPLSPKLSQVQSVQRLWFTTIAEEPPQAITIPDNQNYEQPAEILSPETSITTISEDQRQSMWSRLCIHTYEPTVLPTDLLNVGLRLYLAKVNPIFPLVHAPTFQPCRENADLVIAMCAIGGLFTGSEQSLQQGTYLFERVHKATLHNWEQLLARGRRELTIAIQSAAISQLFGLLSGSPDLLLTVDAFHGAPIAWLRYLRLYSRHQDITHSQIDSAVDDYELTKLWHDWARNEEIVRVAHGLFIMDAELGGTLHHEPIQSWEAYKLPFACSERAFAASNARDWNEIYREELKRQPANLLRTNFSKSPFKGLLLSSYVPESSSLTVYAAMESISSQVLLLRQSCHQESAEMKIKIEDIHELFTDLHHHLLSSPSLKVHTQSAQAEQESLQLRVLQCLIYMEALADFDLLERAVGRDGTKLTTDELTTVTAWASSAHGQRCVLHAIVIKRHVEARNITSEPALHIPRALFWAGLALFCYIRFAPPCNGFEPPARLGVDFGFPEFASMGINRETLVCASGALDNNGLLSLKLSFFSIIDLLQHAGHWRIIRRFATILSALGDFAFGSG